MSENEALFSKERAIRGAKIGEAVYLVALSGGLILMGISDPDQMRELLDFALENPLSSLTGLSYVGIPFVGMGAAIDCFRPTSRLFEREIKESIEVFKEIKDGILRSPKLLNELKIQNLSTIRDNLMGPDETNLRPKFFTLSTITGSIYGGIFWGVNKGSEALDQLMFQKSFPLTTLISEHPVETMVAGGIAGLGIAVSMVALGFEKTD